jgi:hypothetical protein
MKPLLLSQYSKGQQRNNERLNGFIGIPTVTSLFYSKDSIIETINKCWETKELHAL